MSVWTRVRGWLEYEDGTYGRRGSLVEPRNLATEVLVGVVVVAVFGAGWCVWKVVLWLWS